MQNTASIHAIISSHVLNHVFLVMTRFIHKFRFLIQVFLGDQVILLKRVLNFPKNHSL